MSEIQLTTLPNGLRIITDRVPDTHSVAVGVWVEAGTRDEDMTHNGVAHMVEHMLFKGTPTRNAREIVEAIEDVGGSMNAYTSREVTSYHIHLLKEDLDMALEILADMYQNSALPQEEILRERDVILQEIGMCNDTPDELVFDNYYEAAYPGQAFGAPILGRADIVSRMEYDALQAHINKFYTPARTVISAAGALDHDALVQKVEKLFSGLPANQDYVREPAVYKGGEIRLEKQLEQSHFVLGFSGLSRKDENYYAGQALSVVLGGGMSSRLFQEIREKHGLVYTIFSFHSSHTELGQFGIYAGTGSDQLKKVVPLIFDEIKKVREDLSENELERARAQLKSHLVIGQESMSNRADFQVKHLLYHGQPVDLEKIIQKIENIDIRSVKEAADNIFKGPLTLSALGSLDALEDYERLSDRLAA